MSAVPGPASTPVVYGVLQLGAAQVALALDALREVIPCPAHFAAMPSAAPGLVGAVEVRGQVVPVLDLCTVLGWNATGAAERVVVLMRHAPPPETGGAPAEHHLIGLVVHGVRGIAASSSLHGFAAAGGAEALLFSASFVRPEDGAVVSVLDPAAVLRLPGVPSLRMVAAPEEGEPSAAAAGSLHRPMMLVRCGGFQLAIDTEDIHATLPHLVLKASSLVGGACRGVVEHDGAELPAVDPLAVLGLGVLPQGDRCQGVLLRFDAGFVVLLVSEVVDIESVAEAGLLPLPAAALQRPALFSALTHLAGRGEYLVLARGALYAEPELFALASVNVRRGERAAGSESETREAQSGSVIAFDVGTELAAALTDVREIVPFPATYMRAASPNAAIVGLFSHQQRAVALVCLAQLLGLPPAVAGPGAMVLLVDGGGVLFGFIVAGLHGIEPRRWEQPGATFMAAGHARRLTAHPLIEVGQGARRRTLPLLDLPALARRLNGAGEDAPPEAPTAPEIRPQVREAALAI